MKYVVSVWNKVFPKDNSPCEVFMATNCPYAGINKWMEKSDIFLIMGLLFHNGKTSNSEVPIDKINSGVTITARLVGWTLFISEINVFFCCFQELSGLTNTNGYPNRVWDKSKTTWAVGIAQLTHHSVRGGGKNPSTSGLGIFAPTLNLVVS